MFLPEGRHQPPRITDTVGRGTRSLARRVVGGPSLESTRDRLAAGQVPVFVGRAVLRPPRRPGFCGRFTASRLSSWPAAYGSCGADRPSDVRAHARRTASGARPVSTGAAIRHSQVRSMPSLGRYCCNNICYCSNGRCWNRGKRYQSLDNNTLDLIVCIDSHTTSGLMSISTAGRDSRKWQRAG